jgi:hypothetical protein|tara:strand:- start:2698 stop:2967 length:270 start_codon:yes stop_codon:yes gene_type:complete
VNKYDEIVTSTELGSNIGVSGARTYFIGVKQIDEEEFDKLWKVMSKDEWNTNFKNNLQDRQMEKMKYEWWKSEETYLDIDAPITKSDAS